MKKILLLIIILQGFGLYAQTITVKDKSSLTALADVDVNGVKTNAKGQVQFTAITSRKDGLYVFSFSGYFNDSFTAEQLAEMKYLVLLSERSHEWNGIVVSASKFEEKSNDVAQQTNVLKRREMQFMNQPTTAELLQQSGRAFIQKSQMGGGSVVMRGFEANKVLMVIDGVRMNNAIYRGGHLQNVLSIDNNMLEKTEMLFGPGSVVYGSDALGGVIHFYTLNPLLSVGAKPLVKAMAFTRYGTAMNEMSGHFDLNIGFKKIGFLSSVTASDFGDMMIGKRGSKGYESWGRRPFYSQRFGNKDSMVMNPDSFRQVPSAYKQWDIMQKILFRQNDKIKHTLNFQYSNTSNIPRYDRLTEIGSSGKPAQAEWYYGPQKRMFISYRLALDLITPAFDKAVFIAAWQDIDESRHNRSFGSSNITHRMENVKVKTLNADFEKALGKKTELRYGVELTGNNVASKAERENINNGAITPQSTRYPDGGSVMNTSAVYATGAHYLSSILTLNAGLRFTAVKLESKFNDKSFFPFLPDNILQKHNNLSGNLGLVLLPGKDWKISALVSSGFRAPNVDDMAKVFESVGGRVIIPNPDLKAEKTLNMELNINKEFFKRLNIELNAYYTWFNNALTTGKAYVNGVDTMTFSGNLSQIISLKNAQNAVISGVYAGFSYDLSKSFSVNGSVNYTYGRIKTDTSDYPLDHISPLFGRLSMTYKTSKYKMEIFTLFNGAKKSADYNLMGEDNQIYSADPVNGFTPAWFTLNFRESIQVADGLLFQLAVENILDQHYRSFSSGYSAPGRNITLTLRRNF